MVTVAIVENEKEEVLHLQGMIERFGAENNINFTIEVFNSGESFLANYNPDCNIVFMDVDMPGMNGFETARNLRRNDGAVVLVFVTNLARYAIKGYDFNATDYVVKPVCYDTFCVKLKKIIKLCAKNNKKSLIKIKTSNGMAVVDAQSVYYVEIMRHKIVYHTENENYYAYGTLKEVEKLLPADMFFRCNSCYIVNLEHVSRFSEFNVTVGGEEITVSHPRKKAFMAALHKFIAGGGQ